MSEKFKIVVDANGAEISRSPMTRGRMPAGAVKTTEGNWICPPKTEVKSEVTYYITVDANGNETKELKGRGRTRAGYELATEGSHAGNWVKVAVAEVVTA